jgi:hypothetical protein
MAKFLKVPIQNILDSGTDATGTANKLTVASTAAFAVGDYVRNTTDATFAIITAIDSATVVSLSADIMDAAETYVVYSATSASVTKIISAEGVLLISQAAAVANAMGVTVINYSSGTGTDVLTIQHSGNQVASVSTASAFEAAVLTVFSNNSRPEIAVTVSLPSGVGVFAMAIA